MMECKAGRVFFRLMVLWTYQIFLMELSDYKNKNLMEGAEVIDENIHRE